MKDEIIKQISVSFSSKPFEQDIAKFIASKKDNVGVSDYIKKLVLEDMCENNKKEN